MKIWLFICWMLAIFNIPYSVNHYLLFWATDSGGMDYGDVPGFIENVFFFSAPLIITLLWKAIFKKES